MTEETKEEVSPIEKLSKREKEVFFLLCEGTKNAAIAKGLFLSPRTIETHRCRILNKLGCESTVHLVKFALRNNLIEL